MGYRESSGGYSRYARHYRRRGVWGFGRVLLVAALLLAVCGLLVLAPWKAGGTQGHPEMLAAGPAYATASTGAPEPSIPLELGDIADTHYLVLVNRDHPLDADLGSTHYVGPVEAELAWVGEAVPVLSDDLRLQQAALAAVQKLFDAALEEDIHTLYITSAYRDYYEQARLYAEMADKDLVQKPDCSEHQTGLAVDIGIEGVGQFDMAASREGRWLADNAWRFGLVLRYPPDKQKITHIAGEPWHFRYVGVPHAWYCWQHQLCLEEYLGFLQQSGGYCVNLEGVDYCVLYERPQDGLIYVLEGAGLSISSDNTGGYVVTVWE